ncbi:MAG: radical SAM family heme chaperone HemW [Thermostichales cyanobacterium SZTDM-1c_bins_54]
MVAALVPELDYPRAIYLHIPFCRQRCHYCDFATGLGTEAQIAEYVQVLCQEIAATPTGEQAIETIFFGGGTPSLLSGEQLQRIMDSLRQHFRIDPQAEISLEANPGTTSLDNWYAYRAAGINRVSLGVQAFQPHLLQLCGRLHGVEEVYATLADMRQAGFSNFNLDLIFGLPEQTLADWQASLEAVLEIAPPHVSLYDLTLEPNTPFGKRYRPGSRPLPSEEETVAMYVMARQVLLAAGYEHYEISNFAWPGFACRHNRVYWGNQSYYGLGMGATGYVRGVRRENPRTLSAYFQEIRSGIRPQPQPETEQDHWLNTLMLGLRLQEGLNLATLQATFGSARVEQTLERLQPYQQRGWVSWEQGWLRLLPPQGWLMANEVLLALWD